MVGMDNGVMELSAFGVFPLGVLDLSQFVPTKVSHLLNCCLLLEISFKKILLLAIICS